MHEPITPKEWASAIAGILVLLLLMGLAGMVENADSRSRQSAEQRRVFAIRKTFGPRHGSAAVRVARCESGLRPWARNGQYLGLFQMGRAERRRYGHGSGAWAQARAARRYFVASGKDWSPWSCKP